MEKKLPGISSRDGSASSATDAPIVEILKLKVFFS